jgi:hypothetical protein
VEVIMDALYITPALPEGTQSLKTGGIKPLGCPSLITRRHGLVARMKRVILRR